MGLVGLHWKARGLGLPWEGPSRQSQRGPGGHSLEGTRRGSAAADAGESRGGWEPESWQKAQKRRGELCVTLPTRDVWTGGSCLVITRSLFREDQKMPGAGPCTPASLGTRGVCEQPSQSRGDFFVAYPVGKQTPMSSSVRGEGLVVMCQHHASDTCPVSLPRWAPRVHPRRPTPRLCEHCHSDASPSLSTVPVPGKEEPWSVLQVCYKVPETASPGSLCIMEGDAFKDHVSDFVTK